MSARFMAGLLTAESILFGVRGGVGIVVRLVRGFGVKLGFGVGVGVAVGEVKE